MAATAARPDRHQTLLAVIDWSWNLLGDDERRALRRLSVFHDGFSLDGAEAVVGPDALTAVESLVDQSLVTVTEDRGGVRYRMLETVREFGRMQLVGVGEDADAEAARLAWACAVADRAATRLWSPDQIATVRALAVEEGNLADCLRVALAAPDPLAVVRLVAALGGFWTIRGENVRVIALTAAVDAALDGWAPGPDEVDVAVAAASLLGINTIAGEIGRSGAAARILTDVGERAGPSRVRATVRVLAAQDPADPRATLARLDEIGAGPDREAAALARMWAVHHRENVGDPQRAILDAEAGLDLVDDADGPWFGAMLHTLVAALNAQLGRHEAVVRHVEAALPVLDALEADDDAVQCRSLLAVHAMTVGRLGEAERWIDEIDRIGARRSGFGAAFVMSTARAELAMARGDVAEGLRRYRGAVAELGAVTFPGMGPPTGLEPWVLFGESAAATAYAIHGDGTDGRDLYLTLLGKVPAVLDQDPSTMDFPVAGLVLHGLGAWGVLEDAMPPEPAVRLLALAEAFGYPRFTPTMSPDSTDPAAEDRAPGAMARWRARYAGRTAPDLLPEARAVVAQLADAYILRE